MTFFSNHKLGNTIYSSSLKRQIFSRSAVGMVSMMSYIGNSDTLVQRDVDCGFGKPRSLLPGWWKEYKYVCVKPGRTWKCFELGKIKFHIEMFYVQQNSKHILRITFSLKFIPLGVLSNLFISGSFPVFYERLLITVGPSSLNLEILFCQY